MEEWRRYRKRSLVNLDERRQLEDGVFSCLWDDCGFEKPIKLPKRRNQVDKLCCPQCGRDFFEFETEEGITVYYGSVWQDMKAVYANHLKKKK